MWECGVPAFTPWGGGHLFWGLGATLLLAAVLVGVFFLLGLRKVDKTRRADREDSLGIIKVRLAKGEINQEEYLAMKKILEQA
ncbi:SHOCT domain-containing protein [Solidesulfovibrio sp.]|uniref:SHOCT domain-containing protein n=1 Tax=Solidesulfovibrio sp. TaxID=2910990 RepID=UPI0026070BD2|nr:SHOCT domain-containing protein [Solidesulfovibrio sp.]